MADPAQTSGSSGGGSGLAPNIAALLCYLCVPITGIIFLLIEKTNKEVRFHAAQGIVLGIAGILLWILILILTMILPFFGFLSWIVWLGFLALTIIAMVKAYQMERWKIPVLGDFAEKLLK